MNAKINSWEHRKISEFKCKDKKTIIPLSEFYIKQRRKFIVDIITRQPQNPNQPTHTHDPVKTACTNETLQLSQYNRKVVGQPKYHWWVKGVEEYWDFIRTNKLTAYKDTKLNWEFINNAEGRKHKEILELAATAGWGLAKHELTIEQFEQLLAEDSGIITETKEELKQKEGNTSPK